VQEQQGSAIVGCQAIDGLKAPVAQTLWRDPIEPLRAAERAPYGGLREIDRRLGYDGADLYDDRVDNALQEIAEPGAPDIRTGGGRDRRAKLDDGFGLGSLRCLLAPSASRRRRDIGAAMKRERAGSVLDDQ
jgi:hypothetical protein